VQFLVLGPLEVRDGDRIVPLGGAKQRAALAILLLNRNRVVSRDRLVDGIWGDTPPASAAHTLETYISRLRRALRNDGDAERLVTRPPGYLLRVDDGELDLHELEAHMEQGRRALAADDPRAAAATLREALALFRGTPLEDLAYAPFAAVEIGRLDDLRAAALEQRIDADLALGRHTQLIGELEGLVAEHPLREHAWSQLMLARYRSGRQGEALATFDRARHQLAGELGIDPGESLQQLHQQILLQDPTLRLPQPPTTLETPPDEQALAETPIRRRGPWPGRGRTRLLLAAVALGAAALVAAALLSTRGTGRAATVASLTSPNSVALLDSRTHRFLADVDIHDSADALAYGYGAVWAPTDGGVKEINLATHHLTDLPVAANYLALGAGAAWVSSGPKIVRIDPAYGTRRTFPLPTRDFPATWGGTRDGAGLAVAADSLWVAQGARFVRRIDPRTGEVEKTFKVLGAEHLASDDRAVYVDGGGRVRKLDPATNTIVWTSDKVQPEITTIVVAGGFVWLTTSADDGVIKLSADTGQQVGSGIPISGGAERVAAADGAVWVSNERSGTLTRIDTSTNAKTTFPVGHSPFAMAVHGDQLWVSLWPNPGDELRAAGITGTTRVARISLPGSDLDGNADPAMIWSLIGQQLEYATEAKLYNYPDRNGAAGATVVPEVAAGMPTMSADGRTATIRIRPGFRFSPGPRGGNTPVTAETFRATIERSFSPGLYGNGDLLLPQLVGGHAYATGKARRLTGVGASGDTLTLHFTKPVPDLPQILAAPIFSAVPQGTPHTWIFYPSSPSAGPYYLTQPLAPIQWQIILKRNPNYHGPRPHHLDAIVDDLNLQTTTAAQKAVRGNVDVVFDPTNQVLSPTGNLARRYASARPGQPHYLQVPWRGVQYLVLNTNRGPLRDPTIRRAVNQALDRPALAAIDGSLPTDHYLPPGLPGVQADHHVYPITSPNLARARELMHGRTPGLTLWTCTTASCAQRATILQADLAAIGIKLQTRRFRDVRAAGNGYDIRDDGWYLDDYDPNNMLGIALFGQPGYVNPPTTFTDPAWHHRIEHAAKLDAEQGRFAAFGRLELLLMRDAAPWAAYGQQAEDVLLSSRIGDRCAIESPVYGLDLAALCINHGN
jgi:DNA-binding SARP family transcriptional activator/ABC-type oligopeptide transport system substrate-binding subunit/streptogramin lyase